MGISAATGGEVTEVLRAVLAQIRVGRAEEAARHAPPPVAWQP
jgi:hypothetical protein